MEEYEFEIPEGKLVRFNESKQIHLVSDHGVYIMILGEPDSVVYAQGRDPNKDKDFYVDGDDFAEELPLEGIVLTERIKFRVTEKAVQLITYARREETNG